MVPKMSENMNNVNNNCSNLRMRSLSFIHARIVKFNTIEATLRTQLLFDCMDCTKITIIQRKLDRI